LPEAKSTAKPEAVLFTNPTLSEGSV
jgi:hypothetical protein